MTNFLIDSPVSFLSTVTPLQAHFVIFCAVWLPWITAAWVVVYILFRPIPNKCVFAPLENIGERLLQLSVVCASALAGWLASDLLKNYFKIGRPVVLNFNLHPLLSISDYGFPSGHATVFAAIAVSLFLVNRRAGMFAGLLALAIGIARIFAGVHTPLDIIGGYLLGILVAAVIGFVADKVAGKPAA